MPAGRFHFVARIAQKTTLGLFVLAAHAALAVSGFAPQLRLGYRIGDQWEPSIAADGHGHVYVLYPQYGVTPGCPTCTAPSMNLLISDDNGMSWHSSKPLLPFPTGQYDPQIVVDPVDRQTVYASWLQNNKRDIVVARSLDYGRNWSFSWVERGREETDKPVLTVRGADVYVGFNREETFLVAASHDAGQTFRATIVNPNAEAGSSLAGGATVDPSGNIFFGWTAYAGEQSPSRGVNVYVSRSTDGGRNWTTVLLDQSSAPPACVAQACGNGFLGAQIALASDSAGDLYAVWNAGLVNGGPERIYFSSSTTGGITWSPRRDVSGATLLVEHAFPTVAAAGPGDVRVAWMDTRFTQAGHPQRPLWNMFYRASTNGGATWSEASRLSGPVRNYDYILAGGFRFPFGDYFGLTIDSDGNTHAVWGEGRDYKTPGSIWYTRGR